MERCTEVTLTADEYKNIAKELFRPVGRSFIPCQLEEVNFTLKSTRNLKLQLNIRNWLKLDKSQVSYECLKVRHQSNNLIEKSSLNLKIKYPYFKTR